LLDVSVAMYSTVYTDCATENSRLTVVPETAVPVSGVSSVASPTSSVAWGNVQLTRTISEDPDAAMV
jgi:hypothetical protein